MTDAFETGLESQAVQIDIEGLSEADADELRALFDHDDEDVVFSHAFGGVDLTTIFTTFGAVTLKKLIDFFAAKQLKKYDTHVKIGAHSIELKGFEERQVRDLLGSDELKRIVKGFK